MKLLLVTIGILLFSEYTSICQDIKYKELLYLSDKGLDRYANTMAFSKTHKDYNFFFYDVIDNRPFKDRIGSYSESNKIVHYYRFPKALSEELEDCLILSGLSNEGIHKDSVKLEIERFEYVKSKLGISNKGDKARITFTLNFLSPNGKLLYQCNYELNNLHYLFNENRSIDIIQDIILHALSGFNYIPDDYLPDRYLKDGISNYSGLFNNKPKKGFYTSLDELKNNNPLIRPDFIISKENDPQNYYEWEVIFKDSVLENSKEDFFKNVIGFSDGENIYVSALNYKVKFGFNPILEKGKYLYFTGRAMNGTTNGIDGVRIYNSSFGPLGIAGGMAGVLIGAALSAIPIEYQAVIDLESGNLYIFDEDFVDKIIVAAPSFKEKYGNNPNRYNPYMKILLIKEINSLY